MSLKKRITDAAGVLYGRGIMPTVLEITPADHRTLVDDLSQLAPDPAISPTFRALLYFVTPFGVLTPVLRAATVVAGRPSRIDGYRVGCYQVVPWERVPVDQA